MEECNDYIMANATPEILEVEILRGKFYLCPSLKLAKGKSTTLLEDRIYYAFDI